MAVLDAPLWQLGRKRLGPELRVARRARHAPNVGQAADVVLGEQRVQRVERVRRVAHGEHAHRWDQARTRGLRAAQRGVRARRRDSPSTHLRGRGRLARPHVERSVARDGHLGAGRRGPRCAHRDLHALARMEHRPVGRRARGARIATRRGGRTTSARVAGTVRAHRAGTAHTATSSGCTPSTPGSSLRRARIATSSSARSRATSLRPPS